MKLLAFILMTATGVQAWIMERIERERPKQTDLGDIFSSIVGAVSGSAGAIVDTVTRPFESDRRSRRGGRDGTSEGREGRSPDLDGVHSYRQLRGIASNGAKGW